MRINLHLRCRLKILFRQALESLAAIELFASAVKPKALVRDLILSGSRPLPS